MANGELEEDSSIESFESAEATPIQSEVVNSSISSDDILNHARASFWPLEDYEPMNADLEYDKPVNAAVDDGLCSSSPVQAEGFFPDFYPANPVNGSILLAIKNKSRKYLYHLIWFHIRWVQLYSDISKNWIFHSASLKMEVMFISHQYLDESKS